MSEILIIAEKPDVARKIADSLKGKQTKKTGFMECVTPEIKYTITYCFGHLVQLMMPKEINEKYKYWNYNTALFDYNNIPLKSNESTTTQTNLLVKFLLDERFSEIVNACDSDREGELIFRNIYSFSKTKNNNISRLWLKAMTNDAIFESFNNRKESVLYDDIGKSAKLRSYVDYHIGLGATMAMTHATNTLTTIGRVQTPTLRMIVDRHIEILNFIPEEYYKIFALFDNKKIKASYYIDSKENTEIEDFKLRSKDEVDRIVKETGIGLANVLSVVSKDEIKKCNKLYSLSSLQVDMNVKFGYSAQKVLDLAQSLYEKHGLTTYPRTDENTISEEFAVSISKLIYKLPVYQNHCKEIIANNWKINNDVVTKKTDIGAHEAITPTLDASNLEKLKRLSPDEKKVFNAILIRFLQNFFPNAVFKSQKIIIEKNNHKYFVKYEKLVSLGWKALDPKETDEGINIDIKEGDQINLEDFEINEEKTKAPKRFTEATLIKAMKNPSKYLIDKSDEGILKEVEGLGTEATRAGIIENLKKQLYLEMDKKYFKPTDKALKLIEDIPSEIIKSVQLTADIEKKLKLVSKGELNANEVLFETKDLMKEFIKEMKSSKIERYVEPIKEVIPENLLCKCPNCNKSIIFNDKGYFCVDKKECNTFIFINGVEKFGVKKIGKTQAKELFSKGKTKKSVKYLKNEKEYDGFITYVYNKEAKYRNNLSIKNE
ncbi:MAG: DNA topoisomerase [bacterium]